MALRKILKMLKIEATLPGRLWMSGLDVSYHIHIHIIYSDSYAWRTEVAGLTRAQDNMVRKLVLEDVNNSLCLFVMYAASDITF